MPIKLRVRFVPPESLKPYFRNTKIHTEAQLKQMVKILDRFYFDQPIVVDKDMVIIKGHGRYMASLMTQKKRLVPIIVRDDLSEEQITAARISDNRLFDLGESIPELIKSEVVDFVNAGGEGAHVFFDFIPSLGKENTISADSYEALTVASLPEKGQEEQSPVTPDVEESLPQTTVPKAAKPKQQPEAPQAIYCPNCHELHEG